MKHRSAGSLLLALRRASFRPVSGFSIVEVLVAVLIAGGALLLLVPTLSNQLTVSREASRMTAVEAAVSRDLYWLNNYARFWKMSKGIYSLGTVITKTASYNSSGLAEYDPPADRCRNGTLATGFLADAQALFALSPQVKVLYPGLTPPFSPATAAVAIPAATIRVNGANVNLVTVSRRLFPLGNRVVASYSLGGPDAAGLRFTRVASVFLEASAWCDNLP